MREGIKSVMHYSTYMEDENSYYFILYVNREINKQFIFKRKKKEGGKSGMICLCDVTSYFYLHWINSDQSKGKNNYYP